jgi:guanylate kinase
MARRSKSKAIARRGLMLVLSSPSGAGKTTLSRMLLTVERGLVLSISVTTRPRRRGEVNGRHYHFIDRKRFDQLVRDGDLLEYAEVFGNGYGTPRKPVERALKQGRDVLFDIDWQGTQQLRERAEDDLVSVFVLPPSSGELSRRLHTRAQDDKKVIRARMAKASDEMSHWAEYDYVVVNRDLDRAFGEVRAILAANGSDANDNPACPPSCGACSRNSERFSYLSSRRAWRCKETLPRATPLAAPIAPIRRGRCLVERDRLFDADNVVARRRDLHVSIGELETVTLAATQLTSRVLETAALDPFCRAVGVRELQ